MAHASLKLIPGVNAERTPALNEAAISASNLIRFMPDAQSGGLPQKLGGWAKWIATGAGSIVRQLWAWADLTPTGWLAIGAQNQLGVVQNGTGTILNITPQVTSNSVAVSVTTVLGSNVVTITDTGSNITQYDSVWIQTHISVGGIVLFGVYQCGFVSANQFTVLATDAIGNPAPATANVTNGGAVEAFTTTSGSSIVQVTLNNHGLVVGNTYPILISTTVGGITLFGDYQVTSIIDANNFNIQTGTAATSSAGPTSINGGNALYFFFIAQGPLPLGTGYGIGGYGVGGYGSGTPPTANPGTPITTTDWTLDNFGADLVACPVNGAIYLWAPSVSSNTAAVIPTAPPVNNGIFVAMPQRQIVAWGSSLNGIQDPLLVRWCDVDNPTQWIPLVQNQAGSYRVTQGSKIVTALQAAQQSLYWTDVGFWVAQYTGQPDVYSFNKVGVACGCVGQKAAGFYGGAAYWMGQNQFFVYDENGVNPLYCPIWDVVFQNLDVANANKVRFFANSYFNEIGWFFPVVGGNGENSMYVKMNISIGPQNGWDYGVMGRTAWVNQSILGAPIGAGTNFLIYQHEVSPDADGTPMNASFTTGYFAMNEGHVKSFVDQVWPDMKWGTYSGMPTANVQITFYVTDYPGDTPQVFGPFSVTQTTEFITPRFRGRLMAINISSNDAGSFWRLGNIRYRAQEAGKFY